jgi:hypothetical protein
MSVAGRDFQIPGESLVFVKGNVVSYISGMLALGLATDQITVSPEFKHTDLVVNACGEGVPDVQWMLSAVNISMNLIHFDQTVLQECIRLSMGGQGAIAALNAGTDGTMARAGQRLGGGFARFASGNMLIGLNIVSPVQANPYRFHYCYLAGTPVVLPLGVDAQVAQCNWRCIPYCVDPFGSLNATDGTTSGTGALGYKLWDHTLDVTV